MRRFSYLGDHEEVTLYGVTFPQGEPVAVEDPALLKKLEGNNHFKEHAPVLVVDSVDVYPSNRGETSAAEAIPAKRKPGRPRKDS
jgi:hypothetical protein